MFKLLPRQTDFFVYFEKLADLACQVARALQEMTQNGPDGIAAGKKAIKDIEHAGDEVTRNCVDALHKTFITPIDRNEIHRLISAMDNIVDWVDHAAERMFLYELAKSPTALQSQAVIMVEITQAVHRAVQALRDMKNAEVIFREGQKIHELENRADKVYMEAIAALFKEERDPLMVMKLREIYEAIESAADACEDVANIVEGIVLEHA